MNPSTELRLNTMIRGLSEMVIPAIDPKNSLAQEQAQLILGHLHAMVAQSGRERDLNRIELEEQKTLAQDLLAAAVGGPDTQAAAEALEAAIKTEQKVQIANAIENLLRSTDASEDFKALSHQKVMAYSDESLLRSRSWFATMKFDSAPQELLAIESLFS